ncbi:MAG: helix-turn-helix transcriptional regulator [Cyanobacteria bacterium CRU_2_1]|nr:helix-turn-helix transcriptional regulator [Cyanobacteria bacterium CRU_2_1]
MGLTQQQLAAMLDTTQQTIARWESGKTAIPSAILKDLAMILNCTVEDILGTASKKHSMYSHSFAKLLTDNAEQVSLYGGLLLNIESFEEDFRFPINEEQHKFISQFFDDFPQAMKLEWLTLRTMDNWLLFINLRSLTNLVTYNDDVLQAPAFEHPEVYKALTNQLELEQQDLSDDLLEYCKERAEEFEKQNDREIWNYYNEASLYTRQGLEYRIFLNDFNIEQFYEFSIVLHALKDNALHFLRFEDDTVGALNIFNLNHLALIKIPAAAYDNADADE